MTSKDTDHSKRHLKADEKLDAAALREAELTETELGKITGGKIADGGSATLFRHCVTGTHYKMVTLQADDTCTSLVG